MIEDEVPDSQFLCQARGIEHGAMVFLVGLEAVAVLIQAECFTHQPVGALGILTALGTERLIAQTAQTRAVGQQGGKSELTLFRGVDVEALHGEASRLESVAIVQAVHRNEISNALCFLLRKNLAADAGQQVEHLLVAPHAERVSELECHPHDPDAAQQMVRVSMGDEEVADVLTSDSSLLQLGENAITSSGINK